MLQWSWDGVPIGHPVERCIAPLKPEACKFRNPANLHKELKLNPERCNHRAKYTINGDYYCRKHGALRCLDLCDPL